MVSDPRLAEWSHHNIPNYYLQNDFYQKKSTSCQ